MRRSAEQIQHDFYTATAERYDTMHVQAGDEHYVALSYISSLIEGSGWSSVLDVGAGTGRGVRYLLGHHPGIDVRGVEPVRAMIDRAEQVNGVPPGCIIEAQGDRLPFADDSFDVVCELGVLHHVEQPDLIVREMTRVARRAVFLSDENRFARGPKLSRLIKFGLWSCGLWPIAYKVATGGRSYRMTSGDGGVAYSYSVYDSRPVVGEWADRVFLLPTAPAGLTSFHPLFSAFHLLLCALKEQPERD